MLRGNMDLDELDEYREAIFEEIFDTAFYDNRIILALFTTYSEHEAPSPISTFNLVEAQKYYNEFRNWTKIKISDLISDVDDIYQDTYDDLIIEGEDEESADEQAFSIVVDHIANWNNDDSIRWAMEKENIDKNENITELRRHVKEFERWEEWDSSFEAYIEEMPQRIIEWKVFK